MPQDALNNVLVWLTIGNIATLILLLYVGTRLFAAVGRVRRESRRADDTARRMQGEWEEYNKGQSEAIRQKLSEVDERATTLEENTAGRIEEFEGLVGRTRSEIERLEHYLRDVFEVELKNVFDSFDSTVSGVLGEMKGELMRGVDRIEEIQTMMEGRDAVEGSLADSRDAVRSLTSGEAPAADDTLDVSAETETEQDEEEKSEEC